MFIVSLRCTLYTELYTYNKVSTSQVYSPVNAYMFTLSAVLGPWKWNPKQKRRRKKRKTKKGGGKRKTKGGKN